MARFFRDITFMDFSDRYAAVYDIVRAGNVPVEAVTYLSCADIPGTNAYCDEEAGKEIRRRIADRPPEGIHFLDSGNYHYVSLFWLERITRDFSLILFDHHTDMQDAAFGGLLSCGSWVKDALRLPHLREVFCCGVDPVYLKEAGLPGGKVRLLEQASPDRGVPIYLSIDKDVLRKEDARCDWDQGEMTLEELCSRIRSLFAYEIIGVDICGEKKDRPSPEEEAINQRTNLRLLSLFHGCASA